MRPNKAKKLSKATLTAATVREKRERTAEKEWKGDNAARQIGDLILVDSNNIDIGKREEYEKNYIQ